MDVTNDAAANDAAPFEETTTIVLRKPVTFGGESYTEMALREPTAAEWMTFDSLSGVAADMKAISAVSGLPEPVVRMIGARDIITASKWIGRFLSDAQPATAASS